MNFIHVVFVELIYAQYARVLMTIHIKLLIMKKKIMFVINI